MTTPTNFQRVTHINRIASKADRPTWQAAEQQLKVIAGEYDEVVEAIAERNLDKLRDGIADLLVTAYGMGSVLGFNADDDMVSVTTSLMTRFDTTKGDAELTKQKYLEYGVETHICVTMFPATETENVLAYYVTVSSKDQVNQVTGEHIPAGKCSPVT
jgi:NTP pyrophosphatase (non-canonical NTP hydrolase)